VATGVDDAADALAAVGAAVAGTLSRRGLVVAASESADFASWPVTIFAIAGGITAIAATRAREGGSTARRFGGSAGRPQAAPTSSAPSAPSVLTVLTVLSTLTAIIPASIAPNVCAAVSLASSRSVDGDVVGTSSGTMLFICRSPR
jgi:hypothetical protein